MKLRLYLVSGYCGSDVFAWIARNLRLLPTNSFTSPNTSDWEEKYSCKNTFNKSPHTDT